jgi:hypothetical protein
LAFLGVVEPIDAVQENRLAGAIGTDDRKDLTFFYLQAYIHQGLNASESHREVTDSKLNLFWGNH